MCHESTAPAPSTARGPPTLAVQANVHDAMLDLHVPAQVALEVKLAGAVGALEGLTACVQVHVAQQVVHAVEGLPAHLEHSTDTISPQGAWPPELQPPPTSVAGPQSVRYGQHSFRSFLCDPRGLKGREISFLTTHCSCGYAPH